MIAGLQVDIRPLIACAVHGGVHVRVGLEDAAFGEARSNAALVAEAAELVARAGGTLATPGDVRAALGEACAALGKG